MTASDFFTERELEVPSARALYKACLHGRLLNAAKGWNKRLPGRPEGTMKYFYRGQSNAAWGLSSSLYRLIRETGTATEERMARAELAIIQAMRAEGLGKRMKDGELLAVLQHHAIPTRLLDVSRRSLPSLYFATGSEGDDGRLFIIGLRRDRIDRSYPAIGLAAETALPWAGSAIGRRYSSQAWTQTIATAEDVLLDPRMRAQDGCFLVGGLTKRYSGENLTIRGEFLAAEKWPDITALRIFFPARAATRPTSLRWPAVGWTVRVPADWKPELRDLLKQQDYTADHMYPDYNGSRRLGLHVGRRA